MDGARSPGHQPVAPTAPTGLVLERSRGTASPPGQMPAHSRPGYVVLTGNPNCGKTTLFNALTGLRAKVGNYAGVTVERKEGRLIGSPAELNARVLDLPGTYSLSPQ